MSVMTIYDNGSSFATWAVVIAPWFCLHLLLCSPGFEFQAHHQHYFQFVFWKLQQEKDENKQKEAGIGPF